MTDSAARIELSGGAFLRPLAPEDVTQPYVDGLNDADVNRFLVGPRSTRQTTTTVQAFVEMNRSDPDSTLFGFFLEDALRGTVRVHGQTDGQYYVGLAIFDRTIWGQGWGGRLVGGVTSHARDVLGLSELRAVIENENFGSQKAFERSGYVRAPEEDVISEGVQKQMWKIELTGSELKRQER